MKFRKHGKLPKGLKISRSGLIAGIPKKAGTYTFTVKLMDHAKPKRNRHHTTKVFSITVA